MCSFYSLCNYIFFVLFPPKLDILFFMERTLTYTITNEEENSTIEFFLKSQGFTHNVMVQLKKTENGITKNGVWAYTNERLKAGDIVQVKLVETKASSDIEPVKLDFNIVYEDEDIIVVDKPANMPVHPSINNHNNTLANALLYYFNTQEQNFIFRCINRLDRDTTGLTIIAKHSLSAGILSQMVSSREIRRTYLAIVEGKTESFGTIDAPIARKDDSTIERCVNFEKGEVAITHYKRLSYNKEKNLSLIELHLETGRTHQIRVHMKYIGHPLIGDFLYNPNYKYISRQALHSSELTFVHPITKKEMHFQAPLHRDMKCIL